VGQLVSNFQKLNVDQEKTNFEVSGGGKHGKFGCKLLTVYWDFPELNYSNQNHIGIPPNTLYSGQLNMDSPAVGHVQMDRKLSPRTARKLLAAIKPESGSETRPNGNPKNDEFIEKSTDFESSTILYETITPSKKLQ
jgi:hypothetical protein